MHARLIRTHEQARALASEKCNLKHFQCDAGYVSPEPVQTAGKGKHGEMAKSFLENIFAFFNCDQRQCRYSWQRYCSQVNLFCSFTQSEKFQMDEREEKKKK